MNQLTIPNSIIAKNLTVQRGDLVLADNVSFDVSVGQVLHIQGENGTGKSTLLLMMAGVLPVHQGDLTWEQHAPASWSSLFIGHKIGLNQHVNVLDNLRFLVKLQQSCCNKSVIKREVDIEEVLFEALCWAGLAGYEYESVSRLSAGQQRRLQLARLFIDRETLSCCNQRLWLLDEPMTALDVKFADELQHLMAQFTLLGGRIICTSHQPFDTGVLSKVMCLTLGMKMQHNVIETMSCQVVANPQGRH